MLSGAQGWMYSSYTTLLLLGYPKASVFVLALQNPQGDVDYI